MNEPKIQSTNPFLRVAETGKVERRAAVASVPASKPITRRGPRALLNYLPSDSELAKMIDGALTALSRGLRWDRGAILNLLV
jgi:hypothetical protein